MHGRKSVLHKNQHFIRIIQQKICKFIEQLEKSNILLKKCIIKNHIYLSNLLI